MTTSLALDLTNRALRIARKQPAIKDAQGNRIPRRACVTTEVQNAMSPAEWNRRVEAARREHIALVASMN